MFVQKEETVVMQEDGTWVYINEDGVADDSYCGFVSYGGSWWEIRNGVIDFSVNSVDEGIVNGEYGWWNGKWPCGYGKYGRTECRWLVVYPEW